MSRSVTICVMVMVIAVTFLPWGNIAYATFIIESESVIFDLDTQQVLFTIIFNEPPDFYTVDEFGRIAKSFQYHIDFEGLLPFPISFETVIRGPEIYVYGQIPFRNKLGESSDPTSGGWGEIRALVPYELAASTLTFSSSLEAIGDLDGLFSYRLDLYEFGATTDSLESRSVPEPATLLLLGLGAVMVRRKRLEFRQKAA